MLDFIRNSSIGMRATTVLAIIAGGGLVGVALGQIASAKPEPTPQHTLIHGKTVYMQARCFACHGEMGYGGVGPRFREDHFLGLSDYVVGQILVGRGVMPSFANALSNKQIADVASYIRNSWGNEFGTVKPQEVAQVRNELKQKAPSGPHVSAAQQPNGIPAPPAGGQPPGQALPPGRM